MRLIFVIILAHFLFSCSKEPIIQEYKITYPSYFPEPVYTFENNAFTKGRFLLGKELFNDPLLSLDGTVSCKKCHSLSHAFADHNVPYSAGVFDSIGIRNSPVIFNMLWSPAFMWDGGVNHLEVFSVAPITNTLEMHETMSGVVQKLNNSEHYRNKFKKLYGVEEVNDQVFLRAMAQYVAGIVSCGSKYDKYVQGKVSFTANELEGLEIFNNKCSSCHTAPMFTNYSYQNNGLDAQFTDLGRGRITLDPQDNGKFKVPTLRNIELTYPYMHDGRFWTLRSVLDHYSDGVIQSSTISPLVSSGIQLTETEKDRLIDFLKTLTDYEMLNNKNYFD